MDSDTRDYVLFTCSKVHVAWNETIVSEPCDAFFDQAAFQYDS